MKPAEDRRLLPHEIAFGAFIAVTWARLVAVEGPLGGHACLYLALLGLNVLAVLRAPWRLRLLFHPLAMNLLFWTMGSTVGVFHPGKTDLLLAGVDHAFLGTNLSVRLQPLVSPRLTDVMSFCYLVFFPYLTHSMITAFCGDLETQQRHSAGLFTIYAFGFFGYTLLPALGPYAALKDQFAVPLEGGFLTSWNAALVARG
ncbi:MAG: phosphoesterase PA-phosphatase, partial [Planctomycetes bacterium]|nr:phosphoesterase PA-phosphatase [Planctomycetota bacterium]